MRLLLLFCIAFGVYAPAYAQQDYAKLCEQLSLYVPIDGVAFEPSVAEIPADINNVQDPVSGSISIPVELDLVELFDRPELELFPGLDLEPEIANIEINQDGSVFYNGHEISDDIRRKCVDNGEEVNTAVTPKKSRVKVFSGGQAVIGEAVSEEAPVAVNVNDVPVLQEKPVKAVSYTHLTLPTTSRV